MPFPRENTKRRAERLRRCARRDWLPGLYARQNSLCWWCKSATVIFGYLPRDAVLSKENGHIVWVEAGLTLKARMATIDHVTPISEGGGNDESNLVMACEDCNGDRNNVKMKGCKIVRACHRCGGEKPANRSQCRDCFVWLTKAWLIAHGFAEVPGEDEGHTRFVDPETGQHHILRHAAKILKAKLGECPTD